MIEETFEIRTSNQPEAWNKAFESLDETHIGALLKKEPPGVIFLETDHLVGEWIERTRNRQMEWDVYRSRILRVLDLQKELRHYLGWKQRDLDIGLLQHIRRRGELSIVLGAGATVDAGGPSWPTLVSRLLEIVLSEDHLIGEILPAITGGREEIRRRRRVPIPPMKDEQRAFLVSLVENIKDEKAETEDLKRGMQICVELLGQNTFTHVTDLIYDSAPEPGPIHCAVADIACIPEDPGLLSVISYNFDSLAADALLNRGIGVDNYVMRHNELCKFRVLPEQWPGATSPPDIPQGRLVSVYYLHGFTPSYSMDISNIEYVFSTAQYEEMYEPETLTIIGQVKNEFLSYAYTNALYVGCSFEDEEMNGLLLRAGNRRYGRFHYALCRWPEGQPKIEPTSKEIVAQSMRYLKYGVRPIWFYAFEEIPEILASLR